jgi:hypothetical protein
MSIQSQIDRIEQNVANTYSVLNDLGADMPAAQNTDNLSNTAASVKAVLYIPQTLTADQKAQARENIGAINETELTEQLTAAKESGEFDGEKGERGSKILKVTTAPSSYTTATGGFTPTYRIALSTVETQSAATEVLKNDVIHYSYYHYPVGYVDGSYVYLGVRQTIRGATGAAYTLTDADKGTIATAVKSSLPTLTLVGTDADGVAHTWTIYGS